MSTSSPSTTSSTSSAAAGLNSIGGTLQITGLASGLDTDSIISELMAIKQQPLTALQSQESGINARDSQLTTIQTALQKVLSDVQALEDPSLFDEKQSVTTSDATRVSAKSSSGAGVGGYQVSVSQLANSAQRTFSYASPSADDTITIDGHATTISAGESISSFVNSINNDANATVYAAATDSGTVVFSDRQTGNTGTNFIQVSDPGGALTEQTAKAKQGQNAEYDVDGTDYTSNSNTVTNGIAGVTLSLNGLTTSSGPITVNVGAPAADPSDAETAINQFVTDYNSALSMVQTQLSTVPSSTDPTVGTLYQDPELGDMLSSLRGLMYQSGSGLPTGLASMLDLGVSTGAASGTATPSSSSLAGDLTFDASTFEAQLSANPSGVQKVLNAWSSGMGNELINEASAGGSIAGRLTTDKSQVADLDDRIADMQASLTQQQADLTQQYAQLEAALSQNQSEASWLTSQIAALPGAA